MTEATEATKLVNSRRRVDIYFRSNGKIDISSRVAWALSMSVGDVISLAAIGREFYLYISRKAAEMQCNMAHYSHQVRQRHKGCNTFYCNAVSLTRIINAHTQSRESWLYVGNTKQIHVDGRDVIALPLIVGNNQYNK